MRRFRRDALRSLAVVLVVAALAIWRGPLSRTVLLPLASLATGYGISADALDFDAGSLDVAGLRVGRDGLPLLDVARLHAEFDPWALLRGTAGRGSRLVLDLERPVVSLIRRPDGTFGIARAAAGPPGAPETPPAPAAPLDLDVRVTGGAIRLVDDGRVWPESRRFTIAGVAGRVVTRGSRTAGSFAGTLRDADPGAARLLLAFADDAAAGGSVLRLRAARVALRAPADYLIDTPAARLGGGTLRDLDVRWYAFAGGPAHLTGSGSIDGTSLRIPGLLAPLAAFSARVGVTDGAVTFRDGRADLGDVRRLRVAGGIVDFGAPAFDVGVAIDRADLPAIGRLFAFSQRLPIAGSGRADVRLAGPLGSPLVAVGVDLPALAYGRFPIEAARGAVVYDEGAVSVAGLHARYGGLEVAADGTIGVGTHTTWEVAAGTTGPSSGIPYLAQALPDAATHGAGLLTGIDRALDARGIIWGAGPSGTVAGSFHVGPDGVGTFGPLALARSDGGDLAGAYALDRRTGRGGFWLDTRDVAFADAAPVVLPGLEAVRPPRFAGRFRGSLAGVSTPDGFRLRGHLHGSDVTAGPVRIAEADVDVGGAFDRLTLADARASGAFGSFTGTGSYGGGTLALEGSYDGSFERIRPFTGELGASGAIHGPVALAIGPAATFVQARGDRTPGARVRGVPLEGLSGSLAATAGGVRVFAAHADVAGGAVAGAGRLGGPGGGDLAVALQRVDAGRLRGTGLGLATGRLGGFGTVALGSRDRTDFDGGFSLADADLSGATGRPGVDGSASGLLRYDGRDAAFRTTSGVVAGAAADVDGSVLDVGRPGGVRYDLDVSVRSAEAGPFLAHVGRFAEATVGGRLRVTGPAAAPVVRGRIEIPQGRINGLDFGAAAADVDGGPHELVVRDGTVRVGTTVLAFSGGQYGDDGDLRVAAPAVDLADFDDYFDEGDALAGRGRLLASFRRRRGRVDSAADTELRGVRVRSFALGDASAHWSASGPRVAGRLAFGGASGTLDVAGSVEIAPHVALERILETSRYDGSARLRALDLGVWLPALGLQLPVTGRLDGDAIVRGRYPTFDLATSATLHGGTLAHLPITSFHVAADSTLARTRITTAELVLPGLALTGSGLVGLGPRGTVDVRVHGASDDVGALALRLGAGLPVTGAAEADVRIDGPRVRPRIAGGFDLTHATAGPIAISQALGEFQLQGRDVVLSDAEIAFTKSTLYLAGSLPLTVAPFGFGPAAAPITLELQTRDLELSDFAPLLPRDSTLTGRIDGRVRVAGTAGAPELYGRLALANGAIAAPFETTPIRNLGATFAFAGRQMELQGLGADVGGGTLSGDGSVTFADLVHPSADASYAFSARGRRLALDLPAYGRGTVDATLRLRHAPGSPPTLGGTIALSDAVIPFAALYLPTAAPGGALGGGPLSPGGGGAAAALLAAPQLEPQDLALALDVSADRNVRVRSGNIDIGSKGELSIRGTKGAPVLDGSFDSTGGTLTYFNTLFRVQRGTVTFAPDAGLIPTLDARATSHVAAPDPRNLSGSADVTIDVNGPVTSLAIQLSSDPPYSRDQILGLLFSVPAIGGSRLLTQGAAGPGVTPALELEGPANEGQTRVASGDISVGEEAFGVLNAQFTRNLLAPFESAFSESIGLSDLNVNVDYSGSVGFTARKFLGRRVDAIFGESFGYPEQRQSFGFEFRPNESFAAQVTAFQSIGQQLLGVETPNALLHSTAANPRLTSAEPIGGTAGFSFSLQRLF